MEFTKQALKKAEERQIQGVNEIEERIAHILSKHGAINNALYQDIIAAIEVERKKWANDIR